MSRLGGGFSGIFESRAFDRRRLLGLGVAGLVAAAVAPDLASAQEKLKVASIFSTPIEEPWVNQIHEALLHAAEGARHRV